MQLISLNIWGGHIRQPLLDFINTYNAVDIFCLQEVYHNAKKATSTDNRTLSLQAFLDIQQRLPNHQGFFSPLVQGVYGNAVFIKRPISIKEKGTVKIFHNPRYSGLGPRHDRNIQWLRCARNNIHFYIINVHGLWNGLGKCDTRDRLKQSRIIKEFVNSLTLPHILCGDFNLRLDTQSIALLEPGRRNLIRDYQITNTRTSLYTKNERFADYVFTSPNIEVKYFSVLPDAVSDHAPLYLDFSVEINHATINTNSSTKGATLEVLS